MSRLLDGNSGVGGFEQRLLKSAERIQFLWENEYSENGVLSKMHH